MDLHGRRLGGQSKVGMEKSRRRQLVLGVLGMVGGAALIWFEYPDAALREGESIFWVVVGAAAMILSFLQLKDVIGGRKER